MTPTPRHPDQRPQKRAFALVDLLVVVAATVALGPICLSGCSRFRGGHNSTATQARVHSLASGAAQYRADNQFYPGQHGQGKADLAAGMTGSQVLAKALFADRDGSGFPKTGYAQYTPHSTLATIAGRPNTIIDPWPGDKAMAICYYPSRMGATGRAQYVAADNAPYTNGASDSSLAAVITNPGVQGGVYRDGQFILIAAGPARKYFTPEDINNFGGQ